MTVMNVQVMYVQKNQQLRHAETVHAMVMRHVLRVRQTALMMARCAAPALLLLVTAAVMVTATEGIVMTIPACQAVTAVTAIAMMMRPAPTVLLTAYQTPRYAVMGPQQPATAVTVMTAIQGIFAPVITAHLHAVMKPATQMRIATVVMTVHVQVSSAATLIQKMPTGRDVCPMEWR